MNNPLSEHEAYFLSALIITVITTLNIVNSVINAKINKRHTEQALRDISKQLLTQSGYLKKEGCGENAPSHKKYCG